MRAMSFMSLALLCGAMLVGGVLGDSQCADNVLKQFHDNEAELGMKLTACLAEDADENCCEQVNELFAEDGELGTCLCDSEFYDTVLDTVSAGGYSADSIVDMWDQCGVAAVGTGGCGGEVGEPKVKAQLLLKKLKKKLLLKKLVKKAVIASALKAKVLKAKKLKKAPLPVVAEKKEEPKAVHSKKAPKVVAVAPAPTKKG